MFKTVKKLANRLRINRLIAGGYFRDTHIVILRLAGQMPR